MGARLGYSEGVFSPTLLIPLIEAYSVRNNVTAPETWVPELFIHVKFSYETIVSIFQDMWYNEVQPFLGRNKRQIADHTVYVIKEWYRDCARNNKPIFGSDDNAREIDNILNILVESQVMLAGTRDTANALRQQIANYLGSRF